MSQKVHPLILRLGKFLKWDNEWYSQNKSVNSKLVYQTYRMKHLLISYFSKKDILIHSFSSKYINNTIFLNISIIPSFTLFKYFSSNFYKTYFKILTYYNKKLYKLFLINLAKNSKFTLKILHKFLLLKNFSNKYSIIPLIPLDNSANYRAVFPKKPFYKINFPTTLLTCKSILTAILEFQIISNIILTVKDLRKLSNISATFLKKKKITKNFSPLFYFFFIMNKTSFSSLLIGNFVKKNFENRPLKKKQRFFFNNLRRFLNAFKHELIFKKINGLRIHAKGRLDGRDRTSLYKIQIGSIPLSTISQKISYIFIPAFTIHGSFGIKVWISFKQINNVPTKKNKI